MHQSLGRRTFLRTSAAFAAAGLMPPGHRFAQAEEEGTPRMTPIVDTHQHLWDLNRFNLPWLAGAPRTINQSFLMEDFRAAVQGINVVKTIYMEVDVHPAQQTHEAEFAIRLCDEAGGLAAGAVIGGYPHDKSFAGYLKQFAGVPAVKGVRTVLHGDRPRGLCLKPEFVESMKRLGDAGLTFDLCIRPDELLDGTELAGKCPDTIFVLDHCGNVGLQPMEAAVRQVWCEGIKAAAARPNVVCKISGLIDKVRDGEEWSAATLAGNVDFCLDAFGEDRVLFGGDWPVCLLGGTYKRWIEALADVVQDRSADFRRKLFHDNAVRVYRLT